jgi:hypothetical protein
MKMRAGCDDDKYNRRWILVLDEEKRQWFEQTQKERCGCSGADIWGLSGFLPGSFCLAAALVYRVIVLLGWYCSLIIPSSPIITSQ